MIRVVLPAHLRTLAEAGSEVQLAIDGQATIGSLLEVLENRYPVLRGTVRDHIMLRRRPYVRFFVCAEDWSHEPPETPLPEAIRCGKEPFYIVGAIAGGLDDSAKRRSFSLVPERVERVTRRYYVAFCWAAAIVMAIAVIWADRNRALWFDEIISLTLAHVSPAALWAALTSGTDNNPPLFYAAADPLVRLVPSAEVGLRLISGIAFAVTAWCLYRLARPYLSKPFAIAAGFIPLYTYVARYTVEGRPYLLALAFIALALLLWQQAIAPDRRPVHLAGLAIAIACALSSHFSAALLVLALATGEAVRTVQRRRIDWPLILALALGCIPLLLFMPILRGVKSITGAGAFWAVPTLHSVLQETLRDVLPLKLLVGFLVLALLLGTKSRAAKATSVVPLPVIAASLVLLCAPLEGYVQSRFTGAFTMRYAISMVLPVSLAIAIVSDRISRGSATAAAVLVAICTFFGVRNLRDIVRESPNPYRIFEQTIKATLPASQPIAVGTPLLYLPLQHYAPEPIRARLVYLTAPDLALKNRGTNTPDLNVEHLARYAPLRVVSYPGFLHAKEPFVVLMRDADHFTWLGKQLRADSVPLKKLACAPIGCLYQAF